MFKELDWDSDTPEDTITNLFKKNKKKANKTTKDKSKTIVAVNNANSVKVNQKIEGRDKRKKDQVINKDQNRLNGTPSPKVINNSNYGKYINNSFLNKENAKNMKILKINNKKQNNLNKQSNQGNKAIQKDVSTYSTNHKKGKSTNIKETDLDISIDSQDYNTDKPDEVLLNARKRKFNDSVKSEDREDLLFSDVFDRKSNVEHKTEKVTTEERTTPALNTVESDKKTKAFNNFKRKIKQQLRQESMKRRKINVPRNKLRERMLEKLKAAQFRYLNEKLYTSTGTEAQQLFHVDPAAFQVYHEGYQQQVKKWPVKPLDVIVTKIKKMPKSHVIADMGCGEATLAEHVPNTVHSFDLVATNPKVVACDMAHTPLKSASVDVVVFCLALMGSELTKYLVEANRVMKSGGLLLIAEVESRFDNIDNFIKDVERLGFKLKKLDKSNTVFYFMEFSKFKDPPVKKSKLPVLNLKPCLYKKR